MRIRKHDHAHRFEMRIRKHDHADRFEAGVSAHNAYPLPIQHPPASYLAQCLVAPDQRERPWRADAPPTL
jgi:hypothetical protein